MAIDPARVKALFQAAIERGDPAERRAFLTREAGDDAALLDRLEALLAAHDRPPGVLDRPLDADLFATINRPGGTADFPTPTLGRADVEGPTLFHRDGEGPILIDREIAGRYKLRQEIGHGGMGSVYLAEQLQPVKRMVALKLIKLGMDTCNVLARFESERQALALMDHPHIAKVLDAGSTEQGRPFFVMELVKGIPITDYCDRHRLGIPERLAIFRQVCSAVQHAHQKGIIHRDLKPSNILVESHDDGPVPKVIDFGLAKAISGMRLTDQSLFTAFGSVAGTPLYMAPEQADFNALDVDTRADIYALGVVLYELLTGSTPIRRETVQRTALDEMLRVIREVEPPTPSSRIGTSEGLPSLAANRHVEPARLSRLVRGDLDWIVMKALAKERNRRYDAAIGLANDLERYLNHEPVTAGPPTAAYRLRKFVRRHRGEVVAATLVMLALVGGVVGTTLGLFEARRQRGVAVAEARQKEEARRAESDQRRQAERRLAQVETANEILGSIFKDLNPRNAQKEGKPLAALLGERLDQATAAIEGEAIGDPLAVARMQMTLGQSQLGLGYPEKGVGLYTKAHATFAARLGLDHASTIRSIVGIASCHYQAGRRDRALELLEPALARSRAKLGPDHPLSLTTMTNLALCYAALGQHERALKLRVETLELTRAKLGPEHPNALLDMANLAASFAIDGQRDRAIKLLEETTALQKTKLGPDHPDTLWIMSDLANLYALDGQKDRAIWLIEEAIALSRAKLGPDHPNTLRSLEICARVHSLAGQRDRAVDLLEEVLSSRSAKLGPDHPDTLATLHSLADSYRANGQLGLARKLYEKAVASCRRAIRDDPGSAPTHFKLGEALRRLKKTEEAITEYREAIHLDPGLYVAHRELGGTFWDLGNFAEAIAPWREAVRLKPGERIMHINLGTALTRSGKPDEALVEYRLARDLAPAGSKEAGETERLISRTQITILNARLPAILRGEDQPRDVGERLGLALICHDQGRYADSVRFYSAAFDADPRVADDRSTPHRYTAACAAALAGSGTRGDPPPDEAARNQMRRQALDWLRAELSALSKLVAEGGDAGRDQAASTLNHWKRDSDLTCVREGESPVKLAEPEWDEWRRFWADVEALLAKAGVSSPST